MLRLTLRPRQRAVLIEKLPDVGNLGIGALLFGQFVSSQPFSPWLGLTGFALWFALMGITLSIAREDEQ